jgi:hypothetical protein
LTCRADHEWSKVLSNPNSDSKAVRKNPLLYSSIVTGIALLCVGWIFFSRWQENRAIEQKTEKERAQKQLENDRATVELLGGKELAIQMFYATPPAIRRGESTRLCYGVANAKTVKLEPQSNPVWPSPSRCVEVAPTKTTTYTLTIVDAAGNTKSQTLEVRVR